MVVPRRRFLQVGGSAIVGAGAGAVFSQRRDPGAARGMRESEYTVTSVRALGGVPEESGEYCWVAPGLVAATGMTEGQQVRVSRSRTQYAVYTLRVLPAAERSSVMGMSGLGRDRLGIDSECSVSVTARVPHPRYSWETAREESEFIEWVSDPGGSGLVVVAPHGGRIEWGTDHQARGLAKTVASVTAWCGMGWRAGGGAYNRWHITSTDIHPASFPALRTIASRGFSYAVGFHGFDGAGVRIGGGAPRGVTRRLRGAIRRRLPSGIDVQVVTTGDLAGESPRNLVNWLTQSGRSGVQIEQGYGVREKHAVSVVRAVGAWYRALT